MKTIPETLEQKRVVLIGIGGGRFSGKTTIAKKIYHELFWYSKTVLSMNRFLVPKSRRIVDSNEPHSIDYDLLLNALRQLKTGRNVELPFVRGPKANQRKWSYVALASEVIIVDGVFAFFDERVSNLFDVKVFVYVTEEVQLTRYLKCNGNQQQWNSVAGQLEDDEITEDESDNDDNNLDNKTAMLNKYHNVIVPIYDDYVHPLTRRSHYIVPFDQDNDDAVKLIVRNIELYFNRSKSLQIRESF